MRRCVNRHDRRVQCITEYRKSAQRQTQGHSNCNRESESEGKLRQTHGDIVEKPARADDLETSGNHTCRLAGKGRVHDAGARRKFPHREECHHRDGGNQSTVVFPSSQRRGMFVELQLCSLPRHSRICFRYSMNRFESVVSAVRGCGRSTEVISVIRPGSLAITTISSARKIASSMPCV